MANTSCFGANSADHVCNAAPAQWQAFRTPPGSMNNA
jgi:hypothetical protein